MLQYQPQPIYSPSYPGHILHSQSIEMHEHEEGFDLTEDPRQVANEDHEHFDVESGRNELDEWRRNANGPARPREIAAQSLLEIFSPPPAIYTPHPAAWDAVNAFEAQQSMMAHQQHLSQNHTHSQNHHQNYYAASSAASSPPPGSYTHHPYSQNGYQRNESYPESMSSNDPLMTQEEADLKRLRNTAASARFRAKKKRREQSLERSSREKKEKLQALEGRIRDLEAENQWLKDLIMEKNDVRTDRERVRERFGGEGGMSGGEGERKGMNGGEGERKGRERKDGVGT